MTRHLHLVACLWKHSQGVGEQIANPACFFIGWNLLFKSAYIEEVYFKKVYPIPQLKK